MSNDYKKLIGFMGVKEEAGGCHLFATTLMEDGSEKLIPVFHVIRHSPDGFQWGYGGSGPADCALSILTHFVRFDSPQYAPYVEHLYHKFKFDIIAKIDGDLYISRETVANWLEANKILKYVV